MKWLKSKEQQQPTLSLKQQQSEKLAELGARLWASREERASSLEEMVVLTKIPRRLLQAIEEGNLDDLPEPVYIQGLIRQYADVLGLNGAEFANRFPVDSRSVSLPPTEKKQPINLLRPLHLYFLYIFVIVCSVSGLSQLLNNNALGDSNQKSKRETVLKPESNQLNSPAFTNLKPISKIFHPSDKNQSLHIGVTLKASSWIRVVADGKVEFEGVLPEGTQRTWKAEEQLTVKTDNAGSVLMSVNQQAAQRMGEVGTEREIKIGAKPRS
ncbi:helix-turn-helix domain-containing protein [Nodularia sp. UHCC 0506]|uniref:helix-turn-helix domain-containing protein n=1 Tax=Nodularia sp. UHCC 0506 TaxID=3110243 RepID=UPI002B1F943A|nr:RodZ domain-containing protein [Nodularia sp. UHCC 0506]MEA5516119.1 RodZ domain-containing protein [Nodularia sp. UHCC 0506]